MTDHALVKFNNIGHETIMTKDDAVQFVMEYDDVTMEVQDISELGN